MSNRALTGKTIGLAESREADLLASMLEKVGAGVVRCPMVAILDAPDAGPIDSWLHSLVDGEFDDLILLTGEGLRRLLGFADRAGIKQEVVDAVGKVRTITRGPKPGKALREIDHKPDLPAEVPTTEGVIAALSQHDLAGRAVAVQLYATDPNRRLIEFLESAGARVRTVAPYIYAPASDEDRVLEFLERLRSGHIDVIVFTSAPQVDRLLAVARRHGFDDVLANGLAPARVAAVGPVVADKLAAHGIQPDILPKGTSYFMRPLVRAIETSMRGT